VAGLIATTGQGSPGLSRLIPALARQTFPLRGITIVYDGILPKETALPVCPLPLSWIGNPGREPLTRLLNQAIAAMPEDFVLWLNDDVVPENNFVEICAAAMGKDPRIGMVTGKILRMDRRTIDTTGQFLSRDRRAMERGYGSTDIGRFNSGGFVFGACGAAVLYRRTMLEDTALAPGEYFDNQYHLFFEDLDLSWRAQNFGWKAYYAPEAIAYHQRGATAKRKKPWFPPARRYEFAWLDSRLKTDVVKNRYLTIIKNDRGVDFFFNLPFILFYDIKLFLYCLVFDPGVIAASVRAVPGYIAAFQKRKQIRDRLAARQRRPPGA